MRIQATLPWPPSTNSLYRAGSKANQRYLTDTARAYRGRVLEALMIQHIPRNHCDERIAVLLSISAPTSGRYDRCDLDNRIKAVLDALQHCGVFVDDEQVDLLIVARQPRTKDGGVDVAIRSESDAGEPLN